MMEKVLNEELLKEKKKTFESFLKFKDRAIDSEQGSGFCNNIPEKHVQFFYCKYSFCLFKILRVEGVNTCYIYYMFSDKKEDFRHCYFAMINYCLGNNVKFIYYSEKEKKKFYKEFLKDKGFNLDVTHRVYPKSFTCSKCGQDNKHCTCKTNNLYV